MNKAEMIAEIAVNSKLSKKDSETALNAFVDAVGTAMKKADKVTLVGFGTFEVRKRAARKGMNPKTKEVIQIKASKAPVFKAGKSLKDLVNGVKAAKKVEKDVEKVEKKSEKKKNRLNKKATSSK